MKAALLFAFALFTAASTLAQPQPPQPPRPLPKAGEAASLEKAEKDFSNYRITVNWSDAKAGTNFLQVLTAQGNFTLETVQSAVRIGNNDVPTTVSFNGTLSEINEHKVKVTVFLGRTVPYVTSTYGQGNAQNQSYQQLRVGLNSTLGVTLGKPVIIQSDQNGDVTLTVRRVE
jgi:hypothetical protein